MAKTKLDKMNEWIDENLKELTENFIDGHSDAFLDYCIREYKENKGDY